MSLVHLFENKTNPTEQNVKNYLTGNLCRCTGYQPIIKAALDVDVNKVIPLKRLFNFEKADAELIAKTEPGILIEFENGEFFAPRSLQEAVDYKVRRPKVRIFSGATDLGVQINKGKTVGEHRMSLHLVDELSQISERAGQVFVGARVTLSQLQGAISQNAPEFSEFLNIFASPQIKNSATLVGNIANGSPIADTLPFLMAVDANLVLMSARGERTCPIGEFYKAYKTFDLQPDEFISQIFWSIENLENSKMGLYKVSQRRDLDISCVNAGFRIRLSGDKIEEARVVYGGVAAVPLRLKAIEDQLVGQKPSKALFAKAQSEIATAIKPLSDVRGSAEYRQLMAQELFGKFVQEKLGL